MPAQDDERANARGLSNKESTVRSPVSFDDLTQSPTLQLEPKKVPHCALDS
jgi:hypothetical protein